MKGEGSSAVKSEDGREIGGGLGRESGISGLGRESGIWGLGRTREDSWGGLDGGVKCKFWTKFSRSDSASGSVSVAELKSKVSEGISTMGEPFIDVFSMDGE